MYIRPKVDLKNTFKSDFPRLNCCPLLRASLNVAILPISFANAFHFRSCQPLQKIYFGISNFQGEILFP